MHRILVVEDKKELFKLEKHVLEAVFEEERQVHIQQAPNIESALSELDKPWEVVLVDYFLGPPAKHQEQVIRNGAELVVARRQLEKELGLKPSFIVGISNVQKGNTSITEAGANVAYNKSLLSEIALEVKRSLENQ